ncbi:MAG: AAA family ATPase [Desulfocucumaceae bacterium]
MNINIYNFGPIKKFDLDFSKDLTVIYGRNNIGKSYAISMLYLILKSLTNSSSFKRIALFMINDNQGPNKDKISDLKKKIAEASKQIDITRQINSIVADKLNEAIIDDLGISLRNTFGDFPNMKGNVDENSRISLKISNYEITFTIGETIRVSSFSSGLIFKGKQSKSNVKYTTRDNKVFFYLNPRNDMFGHTITHHVQKILSEFKFAIRRKISSIFFFPASRSGIYTAVSAFGQIMADFSKNRYLTNKTVSLPSFSEPISDYILKMHEISLKTKKDMFVDVAKEIEQDILKGEVVYDDNKKTMLFKPKNTTQLLEMNATSSMVAEVSPIVLFFKHILTPPVNNSSNLPKAIVFIEEPEAHLHPEAQVKLIEVFSGLVGSNIKLVMTSHSNYIFNKLNNLVIGNKLTVEQYCPLVLIETERGSISKESELDELGADDDNFRDVTEKLLKERNEFIHLLNQE